MARASPLGTVGSVCIATSSMGQLVVSARGVVAKALTPADAGGVGVRPDPSRWVARSVLPSLPQESAHGLRGQDTRETTDRSLVRSSTMASSFEHATKRFSPASSARMPAGSAQTVALVDVFAPVVALIA